MKIYLAHSTHFPFQEKLYQPIKNSILAREHEFYFPHEHEVTEVTRELIKDCDLVIADVSVPSHGVGIEMGWADTAQVPIMSMAEEGSSVSAAVAVVAKQHFSYQSSEDMLEQLTKLLSTTSN